MANRPTVWVCMTCGKRSKDRAGHQPLTRGWDISCSLAAQECYEDALILNDQGRVTAFKTNAFV